MVVAVLVLKVCVVARVATPAQREDRAAADREREKFLSAPRRCSAVNPPRSKPESFLSDARCPVLVDETLPHWIT